MSRVVGVARAGRLEDERHARRSPGGRSSSSERADADVALADPLVPVLEARRGRPSSRWRAPAAAGRVRRSRRSGRRSPSYRPARRAVRPAAKTWQVSRQMPALGWWSSASRYGARSSTPAHSDRPWPAVGSSSSHGAASSATASEERQQPLADLLHRRVVAPARRPSPGSTYDPVCTTTPSAPISAARSQVVGDRGDRPLVRRGRRRAEVDEVRRVDERPGSRARPSGRGTRASSAGLPCAQRPAARVADEDLEASRSRARRRSRAAPSTSPLPTWTWVPIGLRRTVEHRTTYPERAAQTR